MNIASIVETIQQSVIIRHCRLMILSLAVFSAVRVQSTAMKLFMSTSWRQLLRWILRVHATGAETPT